MRHYEVVALIHPDQGDQIDALIEGYQNKVKTGGGQVHRTENWGRRALAYPIQGTHKAYYVLMNIECNQDVLNELQTDFRYNVAVIRDLCLSKAQAVTAPSAMASAAEEASKEAGRDANGRRPKRGQTDKDLMLTYQDLGVIQRYIIDSGRILPSRITGVGAKFQRRLTKSVKIARFLALLPYCDAHRN